MCPRQVHTRWTAATEIAVIKNVFPCITTYTSVIVNVTGVFFHPDPWRLLYWKWGPEPDVEMRILTPPDEVPHDLAETRKVRIPSCGFRCS